MSDTLPLSHRAAHIFVFPGDAPGAITLNVVWMERKFDAYIIVSQHVPIYLQQFSSYSNCKCNKSRFSRTAAHIFVSPGDAPAIITQCVARMERKFSACQTPRSMYLSIFNSFGVIRCLSQCVSPKIAFLPHFCFHWGRPWGNHVKCCMDGKRIRCLQIVLLHVPIYLLHLLPFLSYSDIFVKKSSFYHTPLHSTPPLGGFPSEYRHSLWVGKTRMVSLPDGEKNFEDIFIRFDVIHERVRRTDGQTDRQTDRQTDTHCVTA